MVGEWITRDEAAALIRCAPGPNFTTWAKQVQLPIYQLPGWRILRGSKARILCRRSEVLDFRAKQRKDKTRCGGHRFKQEIATFYQAIYEIVAAQRPMTVRQVYYQAVVRHLVAKDDYGYLEVQRALSQMRRETIAEENDNETDDDTPQMPLESIIDNSRVIYGRRSFLNPEAAIDHACRNYWRDFWQDRDEHVCIWLEKDALAAAVNAETQPYDVDVMVARGLNSISFVHRVADMIKAHDCPITIIYLRDLDPTGVTASAAMMRLLKEMLPDGPKVTIDERAITLDQVREHKLEETAEETKKEKNFHYPAFAKIYGENAPSYQLDALPAPVLRKIVREAIQEHVDEETHAAALREQENDRQEMRRLVDRMRSDREQVRQHVREAVEHERKVYAEWSARRKPATTPPPAEPATVSLMITQAQKERLRELGYTDEQIREMTPAAAHNILGIGVTR